MLLSESHKQESTSNGEGDLGPYRSNPISYPVGEKDKANVVTFFVMFCRFEYPLKQAGYLMRSKDRTAAPAWDKYVMDVKRAFDAITQPAFKDAMGYLTSKPPRKQVVRENTLG